MRSRTGECNVELQRAASLYNPQLVDMLKGLNNEVGADFFVAANAYEKHMDFAHDPAAYGFVTSNVACCGQGPYNGIGLCTPLSKLVPKPKQVCILGSIPSI
ncbi:GDSL esterase/lipase [Quillaja saponaria]|uniref:GDSL esterase/lipase n=1 Tax=Quillaja saponaria TaxID=32244 RepID=A0AAD7L7W3_QUISA|nr:GDSL esterase/lipase [Quillaja saponaria]